MSPLRCPRPIPNQILPQSRGLCALSVRLPVRCRTLTMAEAAVACSVDGVAPGVEIDVVEGEGEAVPSETKERVFAKEY